ncbi:MAG: hypothetical protein ABIT37_01655 [Luteolibacter sp.]
MGLKGAGLNRFRQQVDAVLDDFFPASLLFDGIPVTGSSPGGRVVTEYMDAGESKNFRFPFRVPVSSLTAAPEVGNSVDWIVSGTQTLLLEITEVATRPHDARYHLVCKIRRV